MYKEAVSRMSDSWKNWEGQVVDGRFPLQHYLGGRTRTAVFTTKASDDPSRKLAIRIAVADAQEAQSLLDSWNKASKLSHPSLLQITHTGRSRLGSLDVVYVVTDYADEDLSQVLPERALTTAETREVLQATVDVLAYLHGKGFVHGRIKPSNIMAVNNELKLSSDGLFQIGERRPASLAATPYDAPESFREPLQPAADFWSLGVTLVETLTQILPSFDRNKNGGDPALQRLPAPFSEIARHCLIPDARIRWGSAEIRQHLRQTDAAGTNTVGSGPSSSVKEGPVKVSTTPSTSASHRPLPLKTIGILVAGIVAVLVLVLLLRKSPSTGPAVEEPIRTTVQSGQNATVQPEPAPPKPSAQKLPTRTSTPELSHGSPAAADLPASDSDVPGIMKKVLPNPSQSARDTIQGTIRVGVAVKADDAGNVVETRLVNPGPSKYFAGLATKAAQEWKFASSSEGVAPREWLLRFEFRRKGTSAHAEPVR
jgi:serine/threonine protein kinase